MAGMINADGDTWRVTRDEHDRRRAVDTIVFHCVSNSQRPYRVVEVPDAALDGRGLDTLSEEELTALFGRSQVMDFTHDPDANPRRPGFE
jgi:hypothetical protein